MQSDTVECKPTMWFTGRAVIRTEVTDRTTEVLMAMVRVRIRLDMEIRGTRTCLVSMRVLMRDREAGA